MMERTGGRAAPVKMIWMFVTLGLMISCILMLLFVRGDFGRKMLNLLQMIPPFILLAAAASICLSKGSANFALPGIASMCGMLTAQIAQDGDLAVLGIAASLFVGAALGALTGLFTIQSRRNVWLVSGVSSLLLGTLFMALATVFTDYRTISSSFSRDGETVMAIIAIMITVGISILGGLGRHISTNNGDDAPKPGGGLRFVWTLIAGALAGLAGAAMAVRMRGASPTTFSSANEMYIIPALLFGGALIPNLRHSTGEGICGGLAVFFGTVAFEAVMLFFSILGMTNVIQRILVFAISALLLIPNLAIGRRNADAARVSVPEPYPQYPEYRPYE